jgi:PKD repeat protein
MGPNVAGYATLPSSHGFPNDGIVNEAGLFGSSPSNSKVHIHEAGHYCGLYHTFEGGCINSNCQTDNDQVCDTPPDASVSPVNCGAVINTCTTDEDDISLNNPFRPIVNGGLGDQNDLYINYMDYGFQTCQTLFTDGQRVRMLTSLQQIRNTLLDSHGCLSPCTNPLTASFSFTPPEPIQVGTSVQFTSQSTGGVTNWEWFSNNVSFSTSNNPTHSFNQDGTFYIELNVSNGDPACTISILDTIHVTCPIQASFSASDQEVAPGSTVLFTNTGSGYNSVQWFINGVPDAITTDLSHTFDTEGQYMITQISSNDLCEMVANTIIIQVGNSCDSVSAGNDLVICAGDAVQLHGTSPGINNVVSTEWIGGTGQFIPNAQDPNAIYYPSSQEISTGIANLQFKLTFGSSTAGVDASLLAYDHSGEDSIYYISPNTGAIQGIQSNSGHDLTAIGYQFSTHLLYGMSNIVDLPNLYQIDVQTNEVTLILPNLFYDY